MRITIESLLTSLGLPGLAEQQYAQYAGRDVLREYHQQRAAQPDLSGADLYTALIAAHWSMDTKTASGVLRHIAESFADWPNWPELTLRDVASHLVITDYLRSHADRDGTKANIRRGIAKRIPHGL